MEGLRVITGIFSDSGNINKIYKIILVNRTKK